jgi:putative aldouronate transport system permease protein
MMTKIKRQKPFWTRVKASKYLLLMLLPVITYYIMFRYIPLIYTSIAFKAYNPFKGFFETEWVGWKNFIRFFKSPDFFNVMRNTIVISLLDILLVFGSSIVFALLLHEVKNRLAKSAVQTLSYLPHFISIVVIAGMFISFLSPPGGFLYTIYNKLTGADSNLSLLDRKELFWGIYTLINMWKGMGWGSIIFVAALSRVDQQLYEAAAIDGAGKMRRVFAVTLPAISATIIAMLIVKLGQVLNVGYELIILISNSQNYEFSDVISSYVYRYSLGSTNPLFTDFSYAAAIGLFQTAIAFALVYITNKISSKVSEVSLW